MGVCPLGLLRNPQDRGARQRATHSQSEFIWIFYFSVFPLFFFSIFESSDVQFRGKDSENDSLIFVEYSRVFYTKERKKEKATHLGSNRGAPGIDKSANLKTTGKTKRPKPEDSRRSSDGERHV